MCNKNEISYTSTLFKITNNKQFKDITIYDEHDKILIEINVNKDDWIGSVIYNPNNINLKGLEKKLFEEIQKIATVKFAKIYKVENYHSFSNNTKFKNIIESILLMNNKYYYIPNTKPIKTAYLNLESNINKILKLIKKNGYIPIYSESLDIIGYVDMKDKDFISNINIDKIEKNTILILEFINDRFVLNN